MGFWFHDRGYCDRSWYANTLIIHNDKVVIDSPSIVARDRISGKIIAVGKEANLMQGKTHENIKTIRP
jgi:rod shape-determining protein MreB